MKSTARLEIYVAGYHGIVGSAIVLQPLEQGHAKECVRMQWFMLQKDQAEIRATPRCFRHIVVEAMLDDPGKAKQKLGWVPEITAQEMCYEMVAHDLAQARQHALLKHHCYKISVSVECQSHKNHFGKRRLRQPQKANDLFMDVIRVIKRQCVALGLTSLPSGRVEYVVS